MSEIEQNAFLKVILPFLDHEDAEDDFYDDAMKWIERYKKTESYQACTKDDLENVIRRIETILEERNAK